MPVKKKGKQVQKPFSLVIQETRATDLGNQTVTSILDPKSERQYSVKLIWESRDLDTENSIAAPFIIQVTAGKLSPFDSGQTERLLGQKGFQGNYAITSTILRRIPYETIIDASRETLIAQSASMNEIQIALPNSIRQSELRKEERRGRDFDRPDSFYIAIARLYLQAKAVGGSHARKPAIYIQNNLNDPFRKMARNASGAQVRKWIAEARMRGHLPPFEK